MVLAGGCLAEPGTLHGSAKGHLVEHAGLVIIRITIIVILILLIRRVEKILGLITEHLYLSLGSTLPASAFKGFNNHAIPTAFG